MSRKIGNFGENEAVSFLFENNYKIVERNYQTRSGEIDIIAFDDKTLTFIEVKLRKNDKFGAPAEFITKSKLTKIIKAANSYIFENELGEIPWRLDAVLINKENNEIKLIRNIYVEGF